MQSSHIMVIMIVLIVMIASIFRARYRGSKGGDERAMADGETQRLREEVKALKERLHVLERITVEKENSLEREIERLRDQ